MTTAIRTPINMLLLLATLVLFSAAIAEPQTAGFQATDVLLKEANELQADILAPKNYAAADKAYAAARKQADSGRMDKATKQLVKSNDYLRKAIDAAKIANVTFADTLKSRERAVAAEASLFEPALWAQAEEQLIRATRKLESGNLKGGRSDGNRAGKLYTDTELAAIKTAIVGNARVLIAAADADANKVARNAPLTLADAKSLVTQAEAALDGNRYETGVPTALAAEAEYQAKHAVYLARQVARLQAKELTAEELILTWEKPLRDIAGALEVTTDMTSGYAAASEAALERATRLVALNSEKNARISQLEVELGDTESVIEETERLRTQLADVESLFDPSEAQVMIVNNDLVLRLLAFDFPPGRAVIETRYFRLLTDVQRSINILNDASVIVEAHTDSQGGEDENLVLSQERANAVRSYLIANSGVQPTRISAEGFGESRPIASNMYEDGRAQNRRVDIVFKDVRPAATANNAR